MLKRVFIAGVLILSVIVLLFLTFRNEEEVSAEKNVSWNEAIRLLQTGDVEQIVQLHNLTVTLIFENGETVTTQEPAIDVVWTELEKCGAPCQDIIRVTE